MIIRVNSLAELRTLYKAERDEEIEAWAEYKRTGGYLSGSSLFFHGSLLADEREILYRDYSKHCDLVDMRQEGLRTLCAQLRTRVSIAIHSIYVERTLRSLAQMHSIPKKGSKKQTQERGERILRMFLPLEVQSDLIGDLEEEFALVAKRHGEKYAKRWFWWQVIWTSARYFVASVMAAITGKTGSK